MEGNFEYIKVVSALDTFHVDDIGSVVLIANNDQGLEWVLDIHTDLGRVTIREFGPLHSEGMLTIANFNLSIEVKDFNEKYISKRISYFLNDPKREITQVRETDLTELQEKIKNIQKLLNNTTDKISL